MIRLPLVITVAAISCVATGCGEDDSPDTSQVSAQPCQTEPTGQHAGADAAAARAAAIAYFLTCDPAACTEDATKNHIRADYDGDLAQCETVRRNNKLTRDDLRTASQATVTGSDATLEGQVLITGETFVVELKLVDGSWKVDRIRGSQ
jgi:hypothetical protein